MDYPTESQLEIELDNLKRQLNDCQEDNLSDEIIMRIKTTEKQLKELTIKNFTI